jgi:formylglycine-generating enzyme required for sulfatase activity
MSLLLATVFGVCGCLGQRTTTIDLGNGVQMELVRIPAGEFTMGSPESEEGRQPAEGPEHVVEIARPFYIGKYEVTGAQWEAIMGENPSWYPGDDLPVNKVSWLNCQEYCQRLSEHLGRTVRLPTEAEWEYACRGGTSTPFSFGAAREKLGAYGWYEENSRRQPNPGGGKLPNPRGLHDVHGNVWEWCEDAFTPSYAGAPTDGSTAPNDDPRAPRVLRGGSWFSPWHQLRSAYRWRRPTGMRSGYIGLRVVVETD